MAGSGEGVKVLCFFLPRKKFFLLFEEKKQKTSAPAPAGRYGTWPARSRLFPDGGLDAAAFWR
jgi:hypothetical protein